MVQSSGIMCHPVVSVSGHQALDMESGDQSNVS